jgi:hypothetical protein
VTILQTRPHHAFYPPIFLPSSILASRTTVHPTQLSRSFTRSSAARDLANTQTSKKSKTTDDSSDPGVSRILEKSVSLTFSLKYLSNFAKSAPLSREVSLHMSNDVPLLVQFDFEQGTLQFFLAPKVCSFCLLLHSSSSSFLPPFFLLPPPMIPFLLHYSPSCADLQISDE